MGVTISNHKRSISLGYGGLKRLRRTISKLVPCKEFVEIYAELDETNGRNWSEKGFSSQNAYFEDYDRRALEICETNRLDEEIVNFLYRADCDCESVSVKTCRHLWKLIRDYDDDIAYGYCGRPDCAKFKDFKQIVEECVRDRRVMKFS